MALSQKHRVALYEFLEPQLGDDVTEAFLSEFPTDPGHELVTKQFLRAELAELRTEMAAMRTEMEVIHTRAMRTTLGAMGVMTALITIFN
jgi:hypothetical protein